MVDADTKRNTRMRTMMTKTSTTMKTKGLLHVTRTMRKMSMMMIMTRTKRTRTIIISLIPGMMKRKTRTKENMAVVGAGNRRMIMKTGEGTGKVAVRREAAVLRVAAEGPQAVQGRARETVHPVDGAGLPPWTATR
jgi:hypothetical protein